jgi:holo-ACP synthase / triphosphoribosyl-dephospho-CoA synthase
LYIQVENKLSRNKYRFEIQKKIIEKYNTPILSFSLRLPEYYYDSPESKALFTMAQDITKEIVTSEKIKYFKVFKDWFIVAVKEEARSLKKKTIYIESDSKIGIFFDFDIISIEKRKISRKDLGYPLRQCIVCGRPAKVCIRESSHSQQEIIDAFNIALEDYFLDDKIDGKAVEIAEKVVAAALMEVCVYPKPGLVSCENSGSHRDMDVGTFILSSTTLTKFFACFLNAGIKEKDPKRLFNKIRAIGNCGERKMYQATHGINTQKGLIFIMGIILSALGALGLETSKEEIMIYIKKMCKNLVIDDFKKIRNLNRSLTSGEEAFINYNITGIRGEAENGFPSVFRIGLPSILEGISQRMSFNDAIIQGLLKIMSQLEDTNLLKRGNIEELKFIQKKASEILSYGGMSSQKGRKFFQRLNLDTNHLGLSPGGAADILAACIFFILLKGKYPKLLYKNSRI